MARRLLRVNEALREALSQAIADGLKDPRVGFVTVTGVKTSSDLRHAKVFVSVLGSSAERERTLAGLRSSHGYLQDRIAAEVRLKRTPQLEFVYDESIDRGQRIEKLLRRHEGELGPVDDEPPAPAEVDDGGEA
jgi:ribosome-binding factor A